MNGDNGLGDYVNVEHKLNKPYQSNRWPHQPDCCVFFKAKIEVVACAHAEKHTHSDLAIQVDDVGEFGCEWLYTDMNSKGTSISKNVIVSVSVA